MNIVYARLYWYTYIVEMYRVILHYIIHFRLKRTEVK